MDARGILETARRAGIAGVFMAYPSTIYQIGQSNAGRPISVGDWEYARQAARGGGAMVFQQDGRPGRPSAFGWSDHREGTVGSAS